MLCDFIRVMEVHHMNFRGGLNTYGNEGFLGGVMFSWWLQHSRNLNILWQCIYFCGGYELSLKYFCGGYELSWKYFRNQMMAHFHGDESPSRIIFMRVHLHKNFIFVAFYSWGLFLDGWPPQNCFVAGFIVFVTVFHSHENFIFW